MLDLSSNHIRKVRIARSGEDPLRARLRMDSTLRTLDLHPPTIAESAIMFVKTLRTADRRRSRQLQESVTIRLNELARSAARPALVVPPANAEAVIFANRAEFLACLMRDWMAGLLHARWWWEGFREYRFIGGFVR